MAVVGGAHALTVVMYVAAQSLLVAYGSHRWLVLWRTARGRRSRFAAGTSAPAHAGASERPHDAWPSITVQLPVFNERRVVDRLIDAVAALDYPRERFEIQVLDDSTDETVERAAAAMARHRACGIRIHHVRRATRKGFKAGALSNGLATARGQLIAVFDADFVPSPDFLRRMAPHFDDPSVGMAQARWTHLNRDASWLTRAQAVMLDSHFLLEHAMRSHAGLFFNFNGTAGLWRRACIEDAGGWQHDTLTEDLDLSYRAQLAGWRFVFDASVEAPAELPGDLEAFKSQQRRWVKGSIQTARKLLPGLLRQPLRFALKAEAVVHLTSNVCYPLLLLLGLLLLPVLIGRTALPPLLVWSLELGVIVFGAIPVLRFLWTGQRLAGRSMRDAICDVAAALTLGVGLSLNNARATLEGLGSRPGEWERTPKEGDARGKRVPPRYASAIQVAGRAEAALAVYYSVVAVWVCAGGSWRALPFVLLLATGFGWVGWGSLRATVLAAR